KYAYRAAPETRSVAEMLAHIALTTGMSERLHGTERRTTLEGFDFTSYITQMLAKEKEPRSKAQVIELLRREGEQFASWLDGLGDDVLAERVSMPPGMTP